VLVRLRALLQLLASTNKHMSSTANESSAQMTRSIICADDACLTRTAPAGVVRCVPAQQHRRSRARRCFPRGHHNTRAGFDALGEGGPLPARERRFLGSVRVSLAALHQAEVLDGVFKVRRQPRSSSCEAWKLHRSDVQGVCFACVCVLCVCVCVGGGVHRLLSPPTRPARKFTVLLPVLLRMRMRICPLPPHHAHTPHTRTSWTCRPCCWGTLPTAAAPPPYCCTSPSSPASYRRRPCLTSRAVQAVRAARAQQRRGSRATSLATRASECVCVCV
jgi:hypothetical protein